jgi:uncharacterized membrane protein
VAYLLGFQVLLLVLIVLVVLHRRVSQQRREIDALARRIGALEHGQSPAVESTPAHEPAPALHAPAAPAVAAPPPVVAAPAPASRRADAEQWVGAVGLQNVGSVLLLVGFFFLVLWGYTTGRFGPLVLVVAGVISGLGVTWRGDRCAAASRDSATR